MNQAEIAERIAKQRRGRVRRSRQPGAWHFAYGDNPQGSSFTKPSMFDRVARRRAKAKRAKQARKGNR